MVISGKSSEGRREGRGFSTLVENSKEVEIVRDDRNRWERNRSNFEFLPIRDFVVTRGRRIQGSGYGRVSFHSKITKIPVNVIPANLKLSFSLSLSLEICILSSSFVCVCKLFRIEYTGGMKVDVFFLFFRRLKKNVNSNFRRIFL